jgi:hypothetical protein
VRRRRRRTDHQAAGDLILGEAFREQIENLVLSLCQRVQLSARTRRMSV